MVLGAAYLAAHLLEEKEGESDQPLPFRLHQARSLHLILRGLVFFFLRTESAIKHEENSKGIRKHIKLGISLSWTFSCLLLNQGGAGWSGFEMG